MWRVLSMRFGLQQGAPLRENACRKDTPLGANKLTARWLENHHSRWWFQIFFIFNPIWGRWTHFDEHIFQMGWEKTTTNHHFPIGSIHLQVRHIFQQPRAVSLRLRVVFVSLVFHRLKPVGCNTKNPFVTQGNKTNLVIFHLVGYNILHVCFANVSGQNFTKFFGISVRIRARFQRSLCWDLLVFWSQKKIRKGI